jgi:hypothetical protein
VFVHFLVCPVGIKLQCSCNIRTSTAPLRSTVQDKTLASVWIVGPPFAATDASFGSTTLLIRVVAVVASLLAAAQDSSITKAMARNVKSETFMFAICNC